MRNSKNGRFRVWDRGVDSFNHDDLVYNFDAIDWIVGGKNGSSGPTSDTYSGNASTWLGRGDSFSTNSLPGTKNSGFEDQKSGGRTLYSVVSGLNYNDVPLGTVIQWWRPTSATDAGSGAGMIPDGWVPCDGRVLDSTQHSYGDFTITVPDLRNKFVLGADPTLPGINATTSYYHESGAVGAQAKNNDWTGTRVGDGQTGAPGVGYDSGLEILASANRTGNNEVRSLDHKHASGSDFTGGLKIRDHVHESDHVHSIDNHVHIIADHSHRMDHEHFMPNHLHNFNLTDNFNSGQNSPGDADAPRVHTIPADKPGGTRVAPDDHVHNISVSRGGNTGGREPMGPGYGFPGNWNSEYWYFQSDPWYTGSWNGYTTFSITSLPIAASNRAWNLTVGRQYNTAGVTLATGNNIGGTRTNGRGKVVKTGTTETVNLTPNTGTIASTPTTTIDQSKGIDGSTASATWAPASSVSSENKLRVLPQYVGLLYLIKVRVSKNLI